MYHPSRGGVRGGKDQFNWDDVKSDKYRENYLGHSVKAPVGRWQKGKDLMWYARDSKLTPAEAAASAREETGRVKQEEENAMREALGLAPRRDKRPQGNRLDKREQEELFKRTKTGEDVEKPYAEGERIEGLGFAPNRAPKQVAPDEKDLLPREAAGEGPLAQIIAHKEERVCKEDEPVIVTREEGAVSVSDEHVKKRKRKEEKKAAKEKRREAKRVAKQARRAKRNRHSSLSSDKEPTKVADKEATRKGRHHDSDSSDDEHDQVMRRKYDLQIDEHTGGKPRVSKDLSRKGHQTGTRNHGSDNDDEDRELERKNNKLFGEGSTRRQESLTFKFESDRTDQDLENIRGQPTISKVVEKDRVGHVRDSKRGYNDIDEHSDEGVGWRTSSSKVQNGEDHHSSRRRNEIPRSDEGFKGKHSSSQREERERKHSGSFERERVHRSYHGERSRELYSHTEDRYREGKYDNSHITERTNLRKHHHSDTDEDMSWRHEGSHERPVQARQEVFNRRENKDLSRASRSQFGYQKRSRSPVQRETMKKHRHNSDSD